MIREELIKKESIGVDHVDDMIDYLTGNNSETYTSTKLLEELAELQEVLLKKINKTPEHQPTDERILEEIGDVFLRLILYCEFHKIKEDDIEERIQVKLNKFLGYIKEGLYSSGI